jgi:subtilase family serine protease
MDQKNAVEIKQSIGSQNYLEERVSDVATAVTKTVVLQNKKVQEIFVRGLGDRYNSTTMNGLPIPSNDQKRKT